MVFTLQAYVPSQPIPIWGASYLDRDDGPAPLTSLGSYNCERARVRHGFPRRPSLPVSIQISSTSPVSCVETHFLRIMVDK